MPWLEWLDRKDDVGKAGQTPYRLLEPVHKLDCGDVDSPNMLIEGDNLDALKALLPYYGGQVNASTPIRRSTLARRSRTTRTTWSTPSGCRSCIRR